MLLWLSVALWLSLQNPKAGVLYVSLTNIHHTYRQRHRPVAQVWCVCLSGYPEPSSIVSKGEGGSPFERYGSGFDPLTSAVSPGAKKAQRSGLCVVNSAYEGWRPRRGRRALNNLGDPPDMALNLLRLITGCRGGAGMTQCAVLFKPRDMCKFGSNQSSPNLPQTERERGHTLKLSFSYFIPSHAARGIFMLRFFFFQGEICPVY